MQKINYSKTLTIHHSPDIDDAFMFYALATGRVTDPGWSFKIEMSDIETLNRLAIKGKLEVTALSVHAFAHLDGRYEILSSGASFAGNDYGPCLVARPDNACLTALRRIAIPGKYTSAALALSVLMKREKLEFELIDLNFDLIEAAILDGKVDAGVLIHEGQLTHSEHGLKLVLNFGEWWSREFGGPLPLGVNAAHKDLGTEIIKLVDQKIRESIQFGLDHYEDALEYALQFRRGLDSAKARKFIEMYVRPYGIDMGEIGKKAISNFLKHV